jgi:hypothetical protein
MAARLQRLVLEAPWVPQRVKAVSAHPAGIFTVHFWAPTFKVCGAERAWRGGRAPPRALS